MSYTEAVRLIGLALESRNRAKRVLEKMGKLCLKSQDVATRTALLKGETPEEALVRAKRELEEVSSYRTKVDRLKNAHEFHIAEVIRLTQEARDLV